MGSISLRNAGLVATDTLFSNLNFVIGDGDRVVPAFHEEPVRGLANAGAGLGASALRCSGHPPSLSCATTFSDIS